MPVPGDSGYIDGWLRKRRHALTEREWRAQRLLHFGLFRILGTRDHRGEAALLADLKSVLDATPVVEAESPPPCPYPIHRAAGDWRGADGRLRCRVCHPPVPGAEM